MANPIVQTLVYEFETSLEAFRKFDTWVLIFSFGCLISVLYEAYFVALFFIFLIIFGQFKKHYNSGQVTAHFRNKYKQKVKKVMENSNFTVGAGKKQEE